MADNIKDSTNEVIDGLATPGGYGIVRDTTPKKAPETLLSFPDSLKSDTELYKNCLHFACVDPITTSGVQAMSTSYRQSALNYSSNVTAVPTKKHLLDIYLYKPLMVTKLAHNYEAVKSNIIDDVIKAVMGPSSDEKSQAQDNPSNVQVEGKNAEGKGVGESIADGAEGLAKSLAGSAKGFLNNATSSAKQQTTGKAYLTPSAAMYKGTNVRTQAFNFKFNPRNKKDLESMAKIIYYFHYFSLPTFNAPDAETLIDGVDLDRYAFQSKGATYYDVPKMWYIDEMFGSTEGKDIKRHTPRFIFGPAAITNIEYNMTPDEFSKTLKGTASDPAAVDLSITFTELIPLDSQQYDAQNNYTEVHNLGPNVRGAR